LKKSLENRNHFLDTVRGICIICVVVFHAIFDLAYTHTTDLTVAIFNFFEPSVIYFIAVFIFISGISCNYSRSNIKRGSLLFFVAMAITFITSFDSEICIKFGILHLLSICIMAYGLAEKFFKRINSWAGLAISAFLFVISLPISINRIGIYGLYLFKLPKVITDNAFLFPFGITLPEFSSGDYIPLLPWFFVFTAGVFLGQKHENFPKFMYKNPLRPFAFLGRYSLWIYLAHQPVIYAVSMLFGV